MVQDAMRVYVDVAAKAEEVMKDAVYNATSAVYNSGSIMNASDLLNTGIGTISTGVGINSIPMINTNISLPSVGSGAIQGFPSGQQTISSILNGNRPNTATSNMVNVMDLCTADGVTGTPYVFDRQIDDVTIMAFVMWRYGRGSEKRDFSFYVNLLPSKAKPTDILVRRIILVFGSRETRSEFTSFLRSYKSRCGDEIVPKVKDGYVSGYYVKAPVDNLTIEHINQNFGSCMVDEEFLRQWSWILENTTGKVFFHAGSWLFNKRADAVHFKLALSGDENEN